MSSGWATRSSASANELGKDEGGRRKDESRSGLSSIHPSSFLLPPSKGKAMTLICRGCSRVNPPGALFCYHDGLALGNGDRPAGPLAVGAQPFLSPFVFPSGRVCRNFDELALAADELWEEAQDLLREGSLAGFLGSIGRADLGRIARQAAAAADLNRALDDFLGRLPTSGREPARLYAHPLAVNLGLVKKGDSHPFQLHLVNQGRGLLHGHLSTEETPWLVLGDPPGVPRRLFECHQDLTLPVHVHLDRLRAAARPQEGRILIESSGGSLAVVVRADRPVQPFEGGLLAGVLTPRQVAGRARRSPTRAAFSLESGAVAAWYDANGWTYPIQGPQATGLGAVQQFFEALGLTTPPRVELSETSVKFQGDPGTALEHTLRLKAAENRPVYAHATSTAPWLRVGRISLEGRTARIRLQVPSVPEMPGETLQGKLLVSANGNQRFTVAVSLSVK